MFNYHTDLVIGIDCALLMAYFVFALLLIMYVIIRDRHSRKRIERLLNIKNNLSRLFLSGDNAGLITPSITNATPSDFLDIETNRQKYNVFFNESEQQVFKEHFITADKIKTLESLAKGAGNKWLKVEAIVALGYTQDDSAPDILEKLLYDKDEDISYLSALAIGQISTMKSVSILMRFLKERPFLRRKIASILESLTLNITDEVIKFADDTDTDVRAWAIKLLSRSVSKEYIKKVEEKTEDPSPEVRAAACASLAKLNDKNCRKALVGLLKDDIWFVKMHAVRALSKIFGGEALPEIMRLINDGSLLVLESVKEAMVDNIDAALPYMNEILAGRDELAKKICKEAMELSGFGKK